MQKNAGLNRGELKSLYSNARTKMVEHGYIVMHIGADNPGDIFHYTTGFSNFGFPEVILTGPLAPSAVEAAFRIVFDRWKGGNDFPRNENVVIGDLVVGDEPCQWMIRTPTTPNLQASQYQAMTRQLCDKPSAPVQLLWPDTYNRLPTHEDYDNERFNQPLL